MPNLSAQTLSSVTLGTPVACDTITMFPLVGPFDAAQGGPPTLEQEPFYLTLDQALGDGWAEITEVSAQGSVPELRVITRPGLCPGPRLGRLRGPLRPAPLPRRRAVRA